ncbi:glycoside hydrolase 5 family protein [Arthrobacter sp. 35W]|uniref:glycoside hydrolase 5 family protein n=1 Tax=Arthrobacter sp. 35W TaxID=1132441 RepID=UPI00041190A6|nr:cellulase family glycosylhydrolase [Arthrobacter sp. 35W]
MGQLHTRFGANYTPSQGWFHHWLDFDLDVVRRDLDSLAALGMDHIRVFALWPHFQPNRSLIRQRSIDDLLSVVDAAAERGLDVSVDGLQGHLSSFDFLPAWTQTWHGANLFTDARVVAGQAEYLRALATALATRPNFLGMSLGNEFSQFSSAIHPQRSAPTTAEADAWLETMLNACKEGAPNAWHHHSEYDAAFFDGRHGFTPSMAARHGSMNTVHSWIFNNTAQLYGGMSEPSFRLAEYLIEVSRGWSSDPDMPIWLQEVGAPSPHVSAEDAAEFTRRTLAYAMDCENLWGVTWWCSHDVSRGLADFPELEYSLGLLANDQTVKPQGAALADAARGYREQADSRPAPAPRTTALVLDVGDETSAPNREQCAPGGLFFEAWMALAADGARPTVVLASKADDAGHLAARGITRLVHPADVDTTAIRHDGGGATGGGAAGLRPTASGGATMQSAAAQPVSNG